MAVSLKLDDEFARKLRRVSDNVQKDTEETLLKCGDVLNEYLLDEVRKNDVLSDEMKERLETNIDNKIIHSTKNLVQSEAGWLFKTYTTVNPPTGVIAIWHNYGTKVRQTVAGYNRGFVHPANFVKAARDRAAKQIQNIQQEILEKAEERWLKTN